MSLDSKLKLHQRVVVQILLPDHELDDEAIVLIKLLEHLSTNLTDDSRGKRLELVPAAAEDDGVTLEHDELEDGETQLHIAQRW